MQTRRNTPSHQRRRVRFGRVPLLVVSALIGASVPVYATFDTSGGSTLTYAYNNTYASRTLPTPAGITCTWTGATSIEVGWTGVGGTYSWMSGFGLMRSTNGGAYSQQGSQITPYTATSATDAAANSPTSNTYTYKIQSQSGTNWIANSAASNASTACIGAISTPIATVPGTLPKLNAPEQEAFDGSGNAYIADTGNHCIRKITASTGFISSFAGTCTTSGSTGDTGLATSAKLNTPEAVAVNTSTGNVYIADTNNATIRMVQASDSKIYRIAGSAGSTGVSVASANGNAARFDHPAGIVVASNGDLYVADRGNAVIRKLTCSASCTTDTNWTVTEVAGQRATTADNGVGTTGQALTHNLNAPEELAINSSDLIYIADKNHHRVRAYRPSDATLLEVAGTGSSGHSGDSGAAGSAAINTPTGVAVNTSTGDLYIAESTGKYIRKVVGGTSAGTITTVAGTGGSGYTGDGYGVSVSTLSTPHGVAVYNGVVYIADTGNNMIRKIADEGSQESLIISVAGDVRAAASGFAGDGASAWAGPGLMNPSGMAVDSSGNVYIADYVDHRIREIVASTGDVATVAGTGVSGTNNDGNDARTARLSGPQGVAVDGSGNLFIADTGNSAIRKVTGVNTSSTTMSTVAGTLGTGCTIQPCGDGGAATSAKLNNPNDVTVDASNNIFIADTNNNRIRKFTVGGNISDFAGNSSGTSGSTDATGTSASFNLPYGITVDGSANLFVADYSNNKIRKITSGQVVTTVAGSTSGFSDNSTGTSAQFASPRDVWVDGTTLYVADLGNHRLRKVTLSGTNAVTTLAGTGTGSTTGDGGPDVSATLNGPQGVTDIAGDDVFIAAATGGNVRKIIGPV